MFNVFNILDVLNMENVVNISIRNVNMEIYQTFRWQSMVNEMKIGDTISEAMLLWIAKNKEKNKTSTHSAE